MITFKSNQLKMLAAFVVAGICYFIAPQEMPEAARRVFFVFVAAALLWSLEIIPLYATSLVVVVALIFLLCRPGGVLGMNEAGYQIFLLPFGSPVIMLFFGGLVLAQALQKYSIDQYLAAKILPFFGVKPYFVMLGFMAITAFLSMWMSNTATAMMMVAMAAPLLKQVKENDPFRVALLLSIAFAANIGGIATPIGTPPNAIVLGMLANEGVRVSFVGWMKMGVPLALIILAAASVILYFLFPSKEKKVIFKFNDNIVIGQEARIVCAVVILAISLWLTSEWHKIPSAVIALFAAGLLAVLGVLKRDDFKNIDWDVLVLMWGGLALGEAITVSGLSQWVVSLPILAQHGFWLVVIFALSAIGISTFMSNTATANLLIPLAIAIPGENNILLAVVTALACSLAMALPISTPPNAVVFSSGMLKSTDMFKAGGLVSLLGLILLIMGYRFMIMSALNG